MAECRLPPTRGVLQPDPALAPPRSWQRALREQALPEGLLSTAWTLSGLADGLGPQDRRSLALLLLAVLCAEAQGSTGLPLQDPEALRRLAQALQEPRLPLELLETEALAGFVGGAGDPVPLVLEQGLLSSRRLAQVESGLAAAARARLDAPVEPRPVAAEVLAQPVALSAEQRRAVQLALSRRLALITGGPGTGKTSIVVAILRAALRAGLGVQDLALAAPTGKAANRMAAAVRAALGSPEGIDPCDQPLLGPDATPQTLHRLLGVLPGAGGFRHHAGNPLRARLVLVDEASMVDAAMLDRLLQALPADSGLVLLGDADQLPSVEPGAVFRDLVQARPEAAIRLTHSYRMAGEGADLLGAARRVAGQLDGGLFDPPLAIQRRSGLADCAGRGVELLDLDEAGLRRFLDAWRVDAVEGLESFDARIRHLHRLGSSGWEPADLPRLEALFAHAERARILAPLKQAAGLRGVDGINAYLHAQVLATREAGLEKRLAFALGEPVLMTRNDPRRGIFNGDQGLMLLVQREEGEPRLEAVFPTAAGFRAFPAAPLLGELELAYALTVHKAQGSEYDRVVLVLPEQGGPLATRDVLYTALTRARRSVTILGTAQDLLRAAATTVARHTSLAARLGPAG